MFLPQVVNLVVNAIFLITPPVSEAKEEKKRDSGEKKSMKRKVKARMSVQGYSLRCKKVDNKHAN